LRHRPCPARLRACLRSDHDDDERIEAWHCSAFVQIESLADLGLIVQVMGR
jgi:hypothetical protein